MMPSNNEPGRASRKYRHSEREESQKEKPASSVQNEGKHVCAAQSRKPHQVRNG